MASNKMHYVDIPIKDDHNSSSEFLKYMLKTIIEKYPKIQLKYGDFIENGYESGYRSNGVYIVNKNNKNKLSIIFLDYNVDDYGTIPKKFLSFTYFEPGYHFEMEISPQCKSYMHNNYIPISINFLTKQKWIKKGIEKQCIYTSINKKYLMIKKYSKYLHKYNSQIIYGEIYLKNANIFDFYEFSLIDNLDEEYQKYDEYDKIIFI